MKLVREEKNPTAQNLITRVVSYIFQTLEGFIIKHPNPKQTNTEYKVIWSQNVYFVTSLQVHLTKKLFLKKSLKIMNL